MKESICQNIQTGDMFFIEHIDTKGVLINSGLERHIVELETFKAEHEDITGDLVPHFFRHVMSMKKSDSSNQETLNLFNTIAYHTLELTKRPITPFEIMGEDEQGSGKEMPTELKNALGYWDRALIYIDVEEGDNEEEVTLIRVILNGYLFISRLANIIGVDEQELADEQNISEYIDVLPRFIAAEEPNDEQENKEVSRIDFDVTVREERVTDEEMLAHQQRAEAEESAE